MEFIAYPIWKNIFGIWVHQCDQGLEQRISAFRNELGWHIQQRDSKGMVLEDFGPVPYCPMCGGRLPND